VEITEVKLSNGNKYLRAGRNLRFDQVLCTYTLDKNDDNIVITWLKDGKQLDSQTGLFGKREAHWNLPDTITREEAGIYTCMVKSDKSESKKDMKIVVLDMRPKQVGEKGDNVKIIGEAYNCGVQYLVTYAPRYPTIVAYCGVVKEVQQPNGQILEQWLQEPFQKISPGQPKLGFNSQDADRDGWTIQKLDKDYTSLSLNATIKIKDLPEKAILWGKCQQYVADKDGNVVEAFMEARERIDEVAGTYQNMCPEDPLRDSDEKTTVDITYTGNYIDNCRGKWGSDGDIVGNIKCKRTGNELKVQCYGTRWQNIWTNGTKTPFSQQELDDFNKTCGVGQLVPAIGLLVISLQFLFFK